jgi:hypothetical protein
MPGVSQEQERTASLLAAFAMGLWILILVALPRSAPDTPPAPGTQGTPDATTRASDAPNRSPVITRTPGITAAMPPASSASGWPLSARLGLVLAMVACLVILFAIPAARTIFALQLPPLSVLIAEAAVVLVTICALSLWRARPR